MNWRLHFGRFSWDLHSALGFWCFLFVLMWGISGFYLCFPQPVNAICWTFLIPKTSLPTEPWTGSAWYILAGSAGLPRRFGLCWTCTCDPVRYRRLPLLPPDDLQEFSQNGLTQNSSVPTFREMSVRRAGHVWSSGAALDQVVVNSVSQCDLSAGDLSAFELSNYLAEFVAILNGFGVDESRCRQSMLELSAITRRTGAIQKPCEMLEQNVGSS